MAYSVYDNKDILLFGFLVERAARHHHPADAEMGHFVFVYLMRAVKLQGTDKRNCPTEQQQQLSVCLPIHVFMVHQPPDANCVAENVCSVWIWENLDCHSTSEHSKMPGM